jgi:hypothetical protein
VERSGLRPLIHFSQHEPNFCHLEIAVAQPHRSVSRRTDGETASIVQENMGPLSRDKMQAPAVERLTTDELGLLSTKIKKPRSPDAFVLRPFLQQTTALTRVISFPPSSSKTTHHNPPTGLNSRRPGKMGCLSTDFHSQPSALTPYNPSSPNLPRADNSLLGNVDFVYKLR